MSKYLKSRRAKERVPDDRLAFAARLVRDGHPLGDAARMARISPKRLRRALGPHTKLQEGEHMAKNERRIKQIAETLPRVAAHAGISLAELADAAALAAGRTIDTAEQAGDSRGLTEGGSGEPDYFENAVNARAAELRQRAEAKDYEQQARAELLDRKGPQWEATGGVELNAMGRLRQEARDQGRAVGEDPAYDRRIADYIAEQKRTKQRDLTAQQAEAEMFDRGLLR